MASFFVGQKVMCVDAGNRPPLRWAGDVPVKGAVYTVRATGIEPLTGVFCLWLSEIRNRIRRGGKLNSDAGYRATRFRPVVERKTDISIFTAMLNPAKTEARV